MQRASQLSHPGRHAPNCISPLIVSPSPTNTMPILQFSPFSSIVSPEFWHKVTDLKIDVLKLSDDAVPITGTYGIGRTVVDRETGKEVVMHTNFTVGGDSFGKEGEVQQAHGGVAVNGSFKNFNTIEEFKALDKTKFFNDEAQKVCFELRLVWMRC